MFSVRRAFSAAVFALVAIGAVPAEGAGFSGKFTSLIARAPVQGRPALEAVRELVRKSFRVLSADARLIPLRRRIYIQFQRVLGRHLDSLRVHALRAGAGLRKALLRGIQRAWHLTGVFVKRQLRSAKIPVVFATVRRKVREGFRLVSKIATGKATYKRGLFGALFPRVAPRGAGKR